MIIAHCFAAWLLLSRCIPVALIYVNRCTSPRGPKEFAKGAAQEQRRGRRERKTTRQADTNGNRTLDEFCFRRLGGRAPPRGLPSTSYGPTLDANWLRAPDTIGIQSRQRAHVAIASAGQTTTRRGYNQPERDRQETRRETTR